MYPSREEFTELIYYISELKHQYSSKIDEQTIKLNDQSCIIEELLWQIRELSDKLRQMSQKVIDMEKNVNESIKRKKDEKIYENQFPPKQRHLFSRQNSSARVPKKADKKVDDNDVYETIEFSDTSSHIYTEPVRSYGQLKKINIRTSARQHIAMVKKKQTSAGGGMKKSTAARNLQKFSNVDDMSNVETENEVAEVELRRVKPVTSGDKEEEPSSLSLVPSTEAEFIRTEDVDRYIRLQNASTSGILINFGSSSLRRKIDIERDSI